VQPPALTPAYKSTRARAPPHALLQMPQCTVDLTAPVFGHADLGALDNDLLKNAAQGGEPIGERIVLHGRVIDQDGRPVRNTLIEIWQANAGGRYRHVNDTYCAPLDPNFAGLGRCVTAADGTYRFRTIRPGPYPWPNSDKSWRPAHIHVSIMGQRSAQRLITQLYFEGDPLVALCPIVQSIPDPAAIDRLVARLDMDAALPFDALAYRFDIVLRGKRSTPFENKLEGN